MLFHMCKKTRYSLESILANAIRYFFRRNLPAVIFEGAACANDSGFFPNQSGKLY